MSTQIYLQQDNEWKRFELGTPETKKLLKEKNIVIHPSANIAEGVRIEDKVSIGEGVQIGKNAFIADKINIGKGVKINQELFITQGVVV